MITMIYRGQAYEITWNIRWEGNARWRDHDKSKAQKRRHATKWWTKCVWHRHRWPKEVTNRIKYEQQWTLYGNHHPINESSTILNIYCNWYFMYINTIKWVSTHSARLSLCACRHLRTPIFRKQGWGSLCVRVCTALTVQFILYIHEFAIDPFVKFAEFLGKDKSQPLQYHER